MVCKTCEKNKAAVICPDPWRDGAKSGNKKLGENKLLASKKRYMPYGAACKICKVKLTQGQYCQGCAYKRGVCSICGKMVLNTKFYKQSMT
mmetsp:Transcript_34711/g.81141  ORF Transcript_34711/g.81141 Transcript_34711/m.81141 type:complete len:91 (+) Transcript_34711:14-286(+)|eukprot:CAMPEP_0175865704 /NCGR_PEP_ID=MMETSP0107_2-20121207/33796_1 /TAXON_ID=195067 ORGANISM="Goniomonas pacifica, Strain CCMP1869" /NCGR_SAMPLE_ID=MMETSP0107_2 /ASSEMBLY_ACC=CAM_ASM_000203 /LENGTH=90 /DNA_ID=CAMNT_0017183139 /DNA_START=14 /DNA_END=286 /DNA_ORIENTATION=-